MTGSVLTDLTGLGQPATVLIEKICNATGILFEPVRIKRKAHAEADALKIAAMAQFEITEIQQRTLERMLRQEERKQNNIEAIAQQAIEALPNDAKTEQLDEDWLAQFFAQCGLVSDEQMQSLWARLLVEEATLPGSFSKRTLTTVATLDKKDAELFTKLGQFALRIKGSQDPTWDTYVFLDRIGGGFSGQYLSFDDVFHLESLGLVRIDTVQGYGCLAKGSTADIDYFKKVLTVAGNSDVEIQIPLGGCLYTKVGEELFQICGAKALEGFLDHFINKSVNQADLRLYSRLQQGE